MIRHSMIGAGELRQGGQMFPLALPLLVLLGLCLVRVVDAGMAVSEKRRLVQAADLVALSGAVWQTRTLNFDAYMNRAIIANEAVIAQSVSLRSFADYTEQLMRNSAVVGSWVPFLGPALRSLERAWSGLVQTLSVGLSAIETLTSLVDHDLAAAQRVMHLGAVQAVPAVAAETLRSIDPRFELTLGGQRSLQLWQLQWARFASFYGGAFRWRQQDVLYRSLDGFSAERRFRWPGTSALGFRIERRGGTELLNFEAWRAVDTLSLHLRRYVVFGSMRERVPLGWGSAAVSQTGALPFQRGVFAGAYQVNPRAARLADRAYVPRAGYLGLPSLFDLSAAQRDVFEPASITVRVRLPAERRRALWSLVLPGSADPASVSRLTFSSVDFFAEASAAVAFARPEPRLDQQQEQPSLYSPYWQARLQAVTSAERLGMAAADSTSLALAGATP